MKVTIDYHLNFMEGNEMDTKDIISTLNDLIEVSKDGEEGFQTCAEDADDPKLKSYFVDLAHECKEGADELQNMVLSLGGDPETSSSLSGTLHRRWIDIKTAFTSHDDVAVLNECERGEDIALDAYHEALEEDLPSDVRMVVERQLAGVQRNHDQIKQLRDVARAHS